ncbi:MAG: hypothetical protein AAGI11_15735 [Pseudomonadota bacterium]
MTALQFSYEELSYSVSTDRATDLEWLTENLAPAFVMEASSGHDLAIDCRFDAHCFEALLAEVEAGSRAPLAVFSMDGRAAEYSGLLSGGAPGLVYDAELECIYRFNPDCNAVSVIAATWRPSVRVGLLRIVREHVSQRLRRGEVLHQHAAAASGKAGAVLICGSRRAGKTTLLGQLLRHGFDYIANDRSLIALSGDGELRVSGMPTVVSVRPRTTELLPELSLAARGRWFARDTLSEVQAIASHKLESGTPGRLSLSPAQFCELLGRRQLAGSRLRYLLFPRVDVGATGIALKPLGTDTARRRLLDNTFALSRTIFTPQGQSPLSHQHGEGLRAEVVERCESFEVTLGTGAINDTEKLRFLWQHDSAA